jgi:hypothetical protein
VGGEEGLDIVEEFYTDESSQQHPTNMTMFRIFRKGCSSRCRL